MWRWAARNPGQRATQAQLAPPTILSPQDMTDYVAYVAKDPINQRGEAQGVGWEHRVDRVSCPATLTPCHE